MNRLLSRMLSEGSGFDDSREETSLSRKPKAEVACGLVADQIATQLRGIDQEDENEVFAGEDCKINGEPIDAYDRVRFSEEILESFKIQDLRYLQLFIEDFHKALKDLKITSIKPLPEYKDDKQEERNKLFKAIKRKVEDNLDSQKGKPREEISFGEPPLILGLKWLLHFLARRDEWKAKDKDND